MTNSPDDAPETEFGVPIPGRVLPESEWAHTALKRLPPPGPLDLPVLFGREAPLVVELGCGNGRFTLLSALARPDHDHLGVDLLPVGIRYATRRANQRGLSNIRFLVRDAESFVRSYLAPRSVAEIHIYHPQPYHDRRDWSRRLITPRFLADLHQVLRPDGLLVLQSDEPAYWQYIREVVPQFFEFQPHDAPWPDAPDGRSRREILARQRGLPIFRGSGRPLASLDEAALRQLSHRLPLPTFQSSRASADLDRLERGPG